MKRICNIEIMRILVYAAFFFLSAASLTAQDTDTAILEPIVKHYYKNEKPVYKNRSQLLYIYCDKPNNNEELFETVNSLKLPAAEVKNIRRQVRTDTKPENWRQALDKIFEADQSKLSIKINECQSVEGYNEKRAVLNLNNQRLMIVSKPVFYANNTHALVKVVFYRSIEHNSGSVLQMQKVGDKWQIKDFLSKWAT